MGPSSVEGRPLAAHSSSSSDGSEEAVLEGRPLAAHGSSASAFEETVLECRPLAARSSTKPAQVKTNPALTVTEKKEAQRARATARKAKSRSCPEQREKENRKRQERRRRSMNEKMLHKNVGRAAFFKQVGAEVLRESGCK